MTKIICMADLHDDIVEVPECDLLIIAGDLSGSPKFWVQVVVPWLEYAPAKEVIFVAGNQDWCVEREGLPPGIRAHYLQDSGINLFGFNIWGSPWQPMFFGSFNETERKLKEKFAKIPEDTQILVTHSPPKGIGDRTSRGKHAGSTSLLARMKKLPSLQLVVCGHIHDSYGVHDFNGVPVINAAIFNGDPPIEVDL